jgi:hypothetical protein
MTEPIRFFSILLGLGLATTAGSGQGPAKPAIRLLLSEVMPGALSADQYCTLVFTDHHFHSEKASRHHGKDTDRKVYEGELSEAEWNALGGILDSKEFRELKVPQSVPPLVMQDTHPYNISVARDGSYQNMEFLDGKGLKPYEPQIKPLLQWWKSLRGRRISESNSPANESCSLDSTHAVFSQ